MSYYLYLYRAILDTAWPLLPLSILLSAYSNHYEAEEVLAFLALEKSEVTGSALSCTCSQVHEVRAVPSSSLHF